MTNKLTQKTDLDKELLVSIIMPTLNEEAYLSKSLSNIINNDFDLKKVELIIIDGGSKDETISIIKSFSKKININLIICQDCSVYKALNIGLSHAKGEYFLRVDARSLIPKDYIRKTIGHFKKGIQCVGGRQIQFGKTLKSKAIAEVTNSFIGTGGAKFRISKKSCYVDSVYLGVYKTDYLRYLGGFEDSSKYVSEDSYINYLIRKNKQKVFLDSSIEVKYPAKLSFRDLAKQYFIYGAGRCFIFKKHGKLTSIRQLIPILYLITYFIILFTSIINPKYLILSIFLLFIHLFFIVLCNISEVKRLKKLYYKIVSNFIIHFGWPVGFISFFISPQLHKFIIKSLT